MTIKEAIEYWEQFKAEIEDLYDTCSDVERDILAKQREVLEFTISALHTQQEKPFGGWISVEDELPERYQPVIICREKNRGEYIVEQGMRDVKDWWKVYGTRTKKVLFWMPLPCPPKEV